MIINLGNNHSIFNTYIAELRDIQIQKDPMRFRENLKRIGQIMAYEISKKLEFNHKIIQTPLGESEMHLADSELVIGTILRAGLPLHEGFLSIFDRSQNLFVSAYRKMHKDNSFTIEVEYLSGPSLSGKTLILVDPMLATGRSMTLAIKAIVEQLGNPDHIHIAAVIASEEGLEYLRARKPSNATIWVGAVDPELNAKAYIVPGLGDAGDLAFGSKV